METEVPSSTFTATAGLAPRGQGRITVLIVGVDSDCNGAGQLHHICRELHWDVKVAGTRAAARQALAEKSIPVVVCNRQLSDGGWKEILQDTTQQTPPPTLIVTDPWADESLWAEVLNLGGYDVLAQPFDKTEIFRVISMACQHWHNHPNG